MDVDDGIVGRRHLRLQRKADECDAGGGDKGAPGNGLRVPRSWCCRLHTDSRFDPLIAAAIRK